MTDSRETKDSEDCDIETSPVGCNNSVLNDRKTCKISQFSCIIANNPKKGDGILSSECNESDHLPININTNNEKPEIRDELKAIFKEIMNFKRLGNEKMEKKNYTSAIELFNKSLTSLNLSSNFKDIMTETNINSIKVECLNNISYCNFQKKEYNKVLEYTQQV